MLNLTNQQLLSDLKSKVSAERDLLVEILKLLQEVDQRRLFLEMGYGSLMDFCVKELGYSASAAFRRISAMRVARDVPAVLPKLESGEISLAVVAQAQTFFRAEEKEAGARMAVEQKSQVLEELEGASFRQAEKILLAKASETLRTHTFRQERIRAITPQISEIKLTLSDETLAKLNQLKMLYSHKMPQANYGEIIDAIASLALEKLDPARKKRSKSSNGLIGADIGARVTSDFANRQVLQCNAKPTSELGLSEKLGTSGHGSINSSIPGPRHTPHVKISLRRKSIPAKWRREVWWQSKGQCTYVDHKSGLRCTSRYQLEIDHIIPIARGGTSEPHNLQLLCRSHNNHKGFG